MHLLRAAARVLAPVILFAVGAMAFGQVIPPVEADAAARLAASPRHGEWVTVTSGDDKVNAFVVYPERSDKAPVVIVIHEIYGLTDWVRAVADQFAAEGFIAVAPDLLSGKAPGGKGSSAVSQDEARALIAQLDPAEITRRLDAVAEYATSLPSASGAFGVVGYCWGGGISFGYATQQPNLGAAVVYYGTPPTTEALGRVKAPVLGLYGGNDARITLTVAPTEAEMKRLGKRYETEIFPGAGHAFLRLQTGANLDAARKAWPRTIAFLKETLEPRTGLAPEGARAVPVAWTPASTAPAWAGPDIYCVCDEDVPVVSAP